MRSDDERHGTTAGYCAGCHEPCCRAAMAAYARRARARRYFNGGALLVDGTGTRRRIQALMALGWSSNLIDARLGQKRTYTYFFLRCDGPVNSKTAERFRDLYERLSMTLPPETTHTEKVSASRTRNLARRKGWPPPLAWDDIDNDPEPATVTEIGRRESVDEVVVLRVLDGERLATSRAEKDEIARRWRAMGKPVNELERRLGWKVERYGRSA